MMYSNRPWISARQWVGALMLATLSVASVRVTQAMEIIPSFGVTKSTDANAGNSNGFGGLALRAALLPFLKLEGGIAYRQDSFAGGDLKVRQWPVTASAWLAPLPMVYAGGGIGWYRTTFDYNARLPIQDTTTDKMGVHLGGGVLIPMAPRVGLDLSGRYIFMQGNKNTLQLPTTFNPDFWTLGVGVAFSF
jgi:opacity protein-like surface antigen